MNVTLRLIEPRLFEVDIDGVFCGRIRQDWSTVNWQAYTPRGRPVGVLQRSPVAAAHRLQVESHLRWVQHARHLSRD